MPKVIDRLWVFVMYDEYGDEAMPSFTDGPFVMPLFAADQDRLESYRPIAQAIADQYQKRIRIVKFEQPALVETLEPRPGTGPVRIPGRNQPN